MTFLKNDQSEEVLEDLYGEKDYYWYLRSQEFCETFLKPMADIINEIGGSVLDVGCGEGQLSQFIDVPYCGIDASPTAIDKARQTYHDRNASFGVFRLENFIEEWKGSLYIDDFQTVVFGGIMEVLVAPEERVRLARSYMDRFDSEYLIIYDLKRLDEAPFKSNFQLIQRISATVNLEGIPKVKRSRKILVFKR